MRIESRQQLIECREQFKKALECQYKQVVICGGSGCVAGGSLNVYDRMKQLMEERGLKVDVVLQHETHDESVGLKHSGCHGFCQMGPLMRIEPMGLLYIKVTVDDCEEIIEKTILNDLFTMRTARAMFVRRISPSISSRPALLLSTADT